MYKLEDKVALITGAASKRGMGRATALRLARDGADVVVHDISQVGVRGLTNEDEFEQWHGLKSVEQEIRALGRRAMAIEADVSVSKQVKVMVTKCIDKFGKIDILVNNAGIQGPSDVPALEIPEDVWYKMFAVNVMGTYLCITEVARHMIKRGHGGKIINFSSISGKFVFREGFSPYITTKFAVIGLTQILAVELAKYKINVNAVCPGPIATEFLRGTVIRKDIREGMSMEEATRKTYASVLSFIPVGRVGQPEDVANVVAFLASSDSDFMTGQAVNVTGGQLMCH